MELGIIAKAIISLGIVFLTLLAILKIIQRYTNIGYKLNDDGSKSDGLKLENVVYIDDSTKVVTLKNSSGNGYILAIGKNNILLLDKITNEIDSRSCS